MLYSTLPRSAVNWRVEKRRACLEQSEMPTKMRPLCACGTRCVAHCTSLGTLKQLHHTPLCTQCGILRHAAPGGGGTQQE